MYVLLNVLISQRVSFQCLLRALNIFYHILLLQYHVPGIESHCSFHAPWGLSLLSIASASLRSKLCYYSSSKHCQVKLKQFPLAAYRQVRKLQRCSIPEREGTGNLLLPPGCTALENGAEARMSKDAMKFPSFEYSFFFTGNLFN